MANETDKPAAAVARPPQGMRDTAKRMGDVSLDALRVASDEARAGADEATRTSGEAFRFARRGADEAAGRMQDWVGGSATAARYAMEASQELTSTMLDFTRASVQRGVDGMAAIARCRTVPELLSVQGDLMRDGLREAVTMGQKLVEIATRASGQTQQSASGATPPSA